MLKSRRRSKSGRSNVLRRTINPVNVAFRQAVAQEVSLAQEREQAKRQQEDERKLREQVLRQAGALQHALHCEPVTLPARATQLRKVEDFLLRAVARGRSRSNGGSGDALYVTGPVGSGKTSVVMLALSRLPSAAACHRAQQPCPVFVAVVDCYTMFSEKAVYIALARALLGLESCNSAVAAKAALAEHFEQTAVRDRAAGAVVLVLDNLDLLPHEPLNKILEWMTDGGLFVLGISPEYQLIASWPPRMKSRWGDCCVICAPYKKDELVSIVRSRLAAVGSEGSAQPDNTALTLLAQRVACISGDVRLLFHLLKHAVDVACARGTLPVLVNVQDAVCVLRELATEPHIVFMQHATTHEKIFLVAAALELRDVGRDGAVKLGSLIQRHQQLCCIHRLETPNFSQFINIACAMSSLRLMIAEPARLGVMMRLWLNMSLADVWRALDGDEELPWLSAYAPRA
jgi:Cdc6-like AAA superfamily ATPase